MGNDNHGHVFLGKFFDNLQHLTGKLRVKCRSRLIEEKNLRLQSQCASNGYTLLLSAGKLIWISILFVRKAQLIQQFYGSLFRFLLGHLIHYHWCIHDVFQYRKMREKVKILKYKVEIPSDFFQFRFGSIYTFSIFFMTGCLSKINQFSAIHSLQHGCTTKQRGFTGTGRSDNRDHLSFIYCQRDILQHL